MLNENNFPKLSIKGIGIMIPPKDQEPNNDKDIKNELIFDESKMNLSTFEDDSSSVL